MTRGEQPRPEPWHSLSAEVVAERLGTRSEGLTSDAARQKLAGQGPNGLAPGLKVSGLKILLAQFQNVLLAILIIATAVSAVMGHGTETVVIGVIVVFAVGLGFFQEYRAERAMEALRK